MINNWENHIIRWITENKQVVYNIAEFLYTNPEIGFREYKAVQLITKTLVNAGFNVESPVGGLDTAFRAEKKGHPGGPSVALVAEYDALPVLGHACGHNLIAAGITGAAIAVSGVIEELQGNLLVLGTPAEEGGGGKIKLLEKNAWQGVDMAISFHPAGETVIEPDTQSACFIEYSIEKVNNCDKTVYEVQKDIIAIISAMVQVQNQIVKGAVSSVTKPDNLISRLRMASPEEKKLEIALKSFKKAIVQVNKAADFKITVIEELVYKKLNTDQYLSKILRKRLTSAGFRYVREKSYPGTTDMGNVSSVIPSLCPLIGFGSEVQLHTQEFLRLAHPDSCWENLQKVCQIIALTVLDIFTQKKAQV